MKEPNYMRTLEFRYIANCKSIVYDTIIVARHRLDKTNARFKKKDRGLNMVNGKKESSCRIKAIIGSRTDRQHIDPVHDDRTKLDLAN